MKLLLVEDNLDLQNAIVRYLTHVGFEVFACSCAEDMDPIFEREQIDVIVLDVMLPGRDGFAACQDLRRRFSGTIIFISAQKEVDSRIQGLNAGADYYLPKPLDMRELEAVIRNIVGRHPVEEDQTGRWTLDCQNWILITPEGDEIGLSAAEKNMLEIIMNEHGEPVERDLLFAALGRSEAAPTDRAVDVMISKLRRKVKQTERELPVRSVRNVGYVFHENAYITGNKK